MPTDAFLSDWGDNALAVAGAVGTLASAVGLVVAFFQLRKLKTAALASAEATSATLETVRSEFVRHLLGEVNSLLREVRHFVDFEDWKIAALRAEDLATALTQLATFDHDRWSGFATEFREVATNFQRLGKNEIKSYKKTSWRKLTSGLGNMLAQTRLPIGEAGGQ